MRCMIGKLQGVGHPPTRHGWCIDRPGGPQCARHAHALRTAHTERPVCQSADRPHPLPPPTCSRSAAASSSAAASAARRSKAALLSRMRATERSSSRSLAFMPSFSTCSGRINTIKWDAESQLNEHCPPGNSKAAGVGGLCAGRVYAARRMHGRARPGPPSKQHAASGCPPLARTHPQGLYLAHQARRLLARRPLGIAHPPDQLRDAAVGPLAVLPQGRHLCGAQGRGGGVIAGGEG